MKQKQLYFRCMATGLTEVSTILAIFYSLINRAPNISERVRQLLRSYYREVLFLNSLGLRFLRIFTGFLLGVCSFI